AALQLRWRRSGMDAEEAGGEFFAETLGELAFAGRVPTLEADDGGDLGLAQGILQAAHLHLQGLHCLVVRGLRQALFHVQGFKHGPSRSGEVYNVGLDEESSAGKAGSLRLPESETGEPEEPKTATQTGPVTKRFK